MSVDRIRSILLYQIPIVNKSLSLTRNLWNNHKLVLVKQRQINISRICTKRGKLRPAAAYSIKQYDPIFGISLSHILRTKPIGKWWLSIWSVPLEDSFRGDVRQSDPETFGRTGVHLVQESNDGCSLIAAHHFCEQTSLTIAVLKCVIPIITTFNSQKQWFRWYGIFRYSFSQLTVYGNSL